MGSYWASSQTNRGRSKNWPPGSTNSGGGTASCGGTVSMTGSWSIPRWTWVRYPPRFLTRCASGTRLASRVAWSSGMSASASRRFSPPVGAGTVMAAEPRARLRASWSAVGSVAGTSRSGIFAERADLGDAADGVAAAAAEHAPEVGGDRPHPASVGEEFAPGLLEHPSPSRSSSVVLGASQESPTHGPSPLCSLHGTTGDRPPTLALTAWERVRGGSSSRRSAGSWRGSSQAPSAGRPGCRLPASCIPERRRECALKELTPARRQSPLVSQQGHGCFGMWA